MRATGSPDSGRQLANSAARPRVYHWMVAAALALLAPVVGVSASGVALAQQGNELAPINVSLPPSPNFNVQTAPETYPDGTMSVYGLRRHMDKYMDKDVQLKAYIVDVYECPAEQRKCNDDVAKKDKKEKKGKAKKGAPPAVAAPTPAGGCRPCDQPHFFMAESPNTKKEHAILVADYPIKDWKTGKPKPLVVKTGAEGGQYTLTGTYAVNSIGGFAASDGLMIHKKLVDGKGNVITEGNAVLPPEAQDIKMDGKAAEKVGAARIDAKR